MRKQTKRKIYQRINPIQYAIEGAAVVQKNHLDTLRMGELQAIDAFRTGTAKALEWHELHIVALMAIELGKKGIGPEGIEAGQQATKHLDETYDRYMSTRRLLMTGPALQSMRDVYQIHDLQRQSIARSEYDNIIRKISATAPKQKLWYPTEF
jgi:hypothetical protein